MVVAWDGDNAVGTARLLSDGVCNTYLVDVWTRSTHRRQGVATAMVRDLMDRVPGQHIALDRRRAGVLRVARLPSQPELYSSSSAPGSTTTPTGPAERMEIRIEGHDLPGRDFSCDGVERDNVHVAVQIGKEPYDLVRGDASEAAWTVDVRVVETDDGPDLRVPAIHGRRGERFLYLTWGQVTPTARSRCSVGPSSWPRTSTPISCAPPPSPAPSDSPRSVRLRDERATRAAPGCGIRT